MPKAYSEDLGVRVIELVQAGVSRREAAEEFSLAFMVCGQIRFVHGERIGTRAP